MLLIVHDYEVQRTAVCQVHVGKQPACKLSRELNVGASFDKAPTASWRCWPTSLHLRKERENEHHFMDPSPGLKTEQGKEEREDQASEAKESLRFLSNF